MEQVWALPAQPEGFDLRVPTVSLPTGKNGFGSTRLAAVA